MKGVMRNAKDKGRSGGIYKRVVKRRPNRTYERNHTKVLAGVRWKAGGLL